MSLVQTKPADGTPHPGIQSVVKAQHSCLRVGMHLLSFTGPVEAVGWLTVCIHGCRHDAQTDACLCSGDILMQHAYGPMDGDCAVRVRVRPARGCFCFGESHTFGGQWVLTVYMQLFASTSHQP